MKLLLMIALLFPKTAIYSQNVKIGIDVIEEHNFDILRNKKIALIANHTSIDHAGTNTVDILIKNGIDLRAIFSPEHGFNGNVTGGYTIGNSTYNAIPVYSLYGKTKRPDDEMLNGIDAILFDIQDVGTRFYTYLTTMGYSMEEAVKKNIEFIVLDRPNPVSSDIIEGPILDKRINAFTAYYNVPVRHSLTPAEMAEFNKKSHNLNLKLTVIKMENYKRDMFYDDTGLIWINPSPNIRNINAAILYSGVGCFEATNISVGRGTDIPFEFFGAPWMDSERISSELNLKDIDGVKFYPEERVPDDDIYNGERVKGIYIKVTDKKSVRAIDIFVNAIYLINRYYPDKIIIRDDEMAKMIGNYDFLKMLKAGKSPEYILKRFKKETEKFRKYIDKNNIKLY